MATAPIYTRLFQVQDRYGISDDTVYRWGREGIVKIIKRGRMSMVRHEEMVAVIENKCGAECGAGTASTAKTQQKQ